MNDLMGAEVDRATPFVAEMMADDRDDLERDFKRGAGLVARLAWPVVWAFLLRVVVPIALRWFLNWIAKRIERQPAFAADLIEMARREVRPSTGVAFARHYPEPRRPAP